MKSSCDHLRTIVILKLGYIPESSKTLSYPGHCFGFTFSTFRPWLLLLLLLFLTFSVLVANPKKLLYTVANPARGLLNREKRTKEKVWQHTPPPTPHTARSEKINKITRRIYRRYAGGRSRVRTRIPSARRLGLWVWLRNSTLPSAIIRFPVSLLLSSPGDV